jgi:hypothetical protein
MRLARRERRRYRRRRGVEFLLKTQQADGSWHVKSRAVKFQPYFQSGFRTITTSGFRRRPRLWQRSRWRSARG